MVFRKKVLGQLAGGIKILILTVLIYSGEICKGYTPKNPTCCEPMDGLLTVITNTKDVKKWKRRDINMIAKMAKSYCLCCASALLSLVLFCYPRSAKKMNASSFTRYYCWCFSGSEHALCAHCCSLFYSPSHPLKCHQWDENSVSSGSHMKQANWKWDKGKREAHVKEKIQGQKLG